MGLCYQTLVIAVHYLVTTLLGSRTHLPQVRPQIRSQNRRNFGLDSAGLASRYENDTRRCHLVMKFVDRSADLDGHARGAGTAFPASGQRDRMRARSQPGDLGEGTVAEWPVDGRGPVEQFALGFVFLKVVALALEAYRLADA